ncbi:MAG: cell division protein SepF [Ilumatobacteraceae bacterium]
MSMFRRAMDYLGLGADEVYDDSDQSVRARRPARGRPAQDLEDDYDDYDDEYEEEAVEEESAPTRRGRARDDSGVTVRGPVGQPPAKTVKPLETASVEPVTLKPTNFGHCKEIGERFKSGQPVIMNMIATDPDEGRRIIDFASGLTFALNGSLERISRGVFRLTPNGVRIPRD